MPGTERNWADLDVPGSFERCVRGSIGELYGFAGLLCGNDRDAAERLVTGVYASLRRAVDGGLTDAVSLGALRSAVRRRWVEDRRIGLLAQIDEARRDRRPAATLAELRELERAVLVLHHVNRMPVDRIARGARHPRRARRADRGQRPPAPARRRRTGAALDPPVLRRQRARAARPRRLDPRAPAARPRPVAAAPRNRSRRPHRPQPTRRPSSIVMPLPTRARQRWRCRCTW